MDTNFHQQYTTSTKLPSNRTAFPTENTHPPNPRKEERVIFQKKSVPLLQLEKAMLSSKRKHDKMQ